MENFKILCFGGAGGNIAKSLLLNQIENEKIFYFNTDAQSIEQSPILNKFVVGRSTTNGLGSGGSPDVAKLAFQEDIIFFKRIVTDNCLYIIAGGLGGGTFTGMAPLMAEIFLNQSKKFVVVATEPFTFEGEKRSEQATNGKHEIINYTTNAVYLENNNLRKFYGNLKMRDAFGLSDNIVSEIIKEILFENANRSQKDASTTSLFELLTESIRLIKEYINHNSYFTSTLNSIFIITEANERILKAITIDKELIHKISPRKFEELIEYIYKLSGYKTRLTKSTRDDGADILVWSPPPVLGNNFLTVIQAKKYNESKKVGSSEVRELLGTKMVFDADKAQIITTSSFSKPAIKTAETKKIDLVKFEELNATIKRLIS